MTPADILDRAADLLTPEGAWVQGHWFASKTGKRVAKARYARCMCAEGAIAKAGKIDPNVVWQSPAGRALAELIDNEIADWNDEPDRTQAEVVAALRAAADKARSEASA